MSKIHLFLLGLLPLLFVQCGSTSIKQGEIYRAPGGVFSVPSPVGYGGRYDDDAYSVAFYDDLMGFYRIEHGELTENDRATLSQYSPAEQLKVFANQAMFPHIKRNFPSASVLHEEWIPEAASHLMVVTIPGGSTYTVNGQHQTVQRGLLFFRQGNRMFVLHTQYQGILFSSSKPVSDGQKVSKLKSDLLALKGSMRFGP